MQLDERMLSSSNIINRVKNVLSLCVRTVPFSTSILRSWPLSPSHMQSDGNLFSSKIICSERQRVLEMICVFPMSYIPAARSCAHLCHCCTRPVMLLIHHANNVYITFHYVDRLIRFVPFSRSQYTHFDKNPSSNPILLDLPKFILVHLISHLIIL